MTWSPQSPDLIPNGLRCGEPEIKGKAANSLSTFVNSFKIVGKPFQAHEANQLPRVRKGVVKAKGGYFEELKRKKKAGSCWNSHCEGLATTITSSEHHQLVWEKLD